MPIEPVLIGNRSIGGRNDTPYLIAELSANHNGSLSRALETMEVFAKAGADAIKIQTYTADTITLDIDAPDFRIDHGPWAGRSLHELYDSAHTPWAWHEALFSKAQDLGIQIFSSPFDHTAVDFLEQYNPPAYKIASFEAVDIPLIEKAASTGKPLILSTGMATTEELDNAVACVKKSGNSGLVLLHCVSAYPAPAEEINLRVINRLRERYEVPVGLSDHTMGGTVAIAAVALGAAVVEKHVILDRNDGGPDSHFSAEPSEFGDMVSSCRMAVAALGSPDVERTAAESENTQFRRSLYVTADIPAGAPFTAENIRSVRPGYGLPPKEYPRVLSARAAKALKRGTALEEGHLLLDPVE